MIIVCRYNFLAHAVNLSTYKINKLLNGWFACTIFIHFLCLVSCVSLARSSLVRLWCFTMQDTTREWKSCALINHEIIYINITTKVKNWSSLCSYAHICMSFCRCCEPVFKIYDTNDPMFTVFFLSVCEIPSLFPQCFEKKPGHQHTWCNKSVWSYASCIFYRR